MIQKFCELWPGNFAIKVNTTRRLPRFKTSQTKRRM